MLKKLAMVAAVLGAALVVSPNMAAAAEASKSPTVQGTEKAGSAELSRRGGFRRGGFRRGGFHRGHRGFRHGHRGFRHHWRYRGHRWNRFGGPRYWRYTPSWRGDILVS